MPVISDLQISNFRNLSNVKIDPSERFNIFYGQNGSGKTSLLESIYYLGLGRSFRTNHAQYVIQHTAECFSVYASLKENDKPLPIGMSKARDGKRVMKINSKSVNSLSVLAKSLPLQLMSPVSYRFFFNGPKVRRQFLDWQLFHVEQSFYPQWQECQKILKQRNSGLKMRLPENQVRLWDNDFVRISNEIDQIRKKTIGELSPLFQELMQELLPSLNLSLFYSPGWDPEKALTEVLDANWYRDSKIGYTACGPQRADLQILVESAPAQDILSQGQQKLALLALNLAQGRLLKQHKGAAPIYLIDDVASELDYEKRNCIAKVLTQLDSQVFITGVSMEDLKEMAKFDNSKLFHVEQGVVQPQ